MGFHGPGVHRGKGAEQMGVASATPPEYSRTANRHGTPSGAMQMFQSCIMGMATHLYTRTKIHRLVHLPQVNLTAYKSYLNQAGLKIKSAWPGRQLRGKRIKPHSRTQHLSPANLTKKVPCPQALPAPAV